MVRNVLVWNTESVFQRCFRMWNTKSKLFENLKPEGWWIYHLCARRWWYEMMCYIGSFLPNIPFLVHYRDRWCPTIPRYLMTFFYKLVPEIETKKLNAAWCWQQRFSITIIILSFIVSHWWWIPRIYPRKRLPAIGENWSPRFLISIRKFVHVIDSFMISYPSRYGILSHN